MTLNSMTELEATLERLNRMVGFGVDSVDTLFTRVRGHSIGDRQKNTSRLVMQLLTPVLREMLSAQNNSTRGQRSSSRDSNLLPSSGNYFLVSQGQRSAEIASLVTKAMRRYL